MKISFSVFASVLSIFCVGTSPFVYAQKTDSPVKVASYASIGDQLNIVTYRPATGSSLPQNRVEATRLSKPDFDELAMSETEKSVVRAGHTPTKVTSFTQTAFDVTEQSKWTDGDTALLPESIATAVKTSGADFLILIKKARYDANLKLARSSTGSGKIDGLGFYVDNVLKLRRSDTQERGVGFIAPFFYAEAALVAVASMKVLAVEPIQASFSQSAARNETGTDAWGAIPDSEKPEALKRLIRMEMRRVTPLLLEKTRAAPPK